MSTVNANQKKLPSIETRAPTRSVDRFRTLEIRGGDYRASTASCRSLSSSSSSGLESSQSGSFGGVEGGGWRGERQLSHSSYQEIPVKVTDHNKDTTVKSLIIPGNTSQATDHNRDAQIVSLIIPRDTYSQVTHHTRKYHQVTDDRVISEITTDYTTVIGVLTRSSSSLKTFD
uniref:Uncharacterized protein n=1 Tax=Vespula pensylvanica TaxID=30213 RepID=A0A834U3P6_VESPE|nr:hypothetical protein H0235_011908 [Vespula pensylvanica]